MPIDLFTTRVTRRLNQLQPGLDWVDAHWMHNRQPWVRIYKQNWTNHPLASTLRGANRNGQYPPLWFEMKCLDNFEGHDGRPPFDIYVPIDERGLNLGNVHFNEIPDHPGQFLPMPDLYHALLLSFLGCYHAHVAPWAYNVDNSVAWYIRQRHFVQDDNGYGLPYNNARVQLDSGIITVRTESDAEVDDCANFVVARQGTLDCAFHA